MAIASQSLSPDRAACQLATRLLQAERDDLTGPLLELARSGSTVYPELLALDAKQLSLQSDYQEQAKKLRQAWELAGPEHEQYHSWLYEWAWALQEQDREREAVQQSPDPALTFVNLAIDDTELMVTLNQLDQMLDGLEAASPIDPEAQRTRTIWLTLGRGLSHLQHRRYEDAWTAFASYRRSRNSSAEDMDNLGADYCVTSWLAEAAVRSGHISDAFEVLTEEEGRFDLLASEAVQTGVAESVAEINRLQRTHDPQHFDLRYYDAVIHQLSGEPESAADQLIAFIKDAENEETYLGYQAHSRLADLVVEHDWWDRLSTSLSHQQIADVMGDYVQGHNRTDLMPRLLELLKAKGAGAAAMRPHRSWLLHSTQQWTDLASDYNAWAADQQGLKNELSYLPYSMYQEKQRYLDALLGTKQFTEAQKLIADHEGRVSTTTVAGSTTCSRKQDSGLHRFARSG